MTIVSRLAELIACELLSGQQFPAHGTAWTQTGRRGNLGKPTENEDESLSHRFCDIRSPAVGRRRCLRRPSRRNPIFTECLRRPGIAAPTVTSVGLPRQLPEDAHASLAEFEKSSIELSHAQQLAGRAGLIRFIDSGDRSPASSHLSYLKHEPYTRPVRTVL